MRTTLTVDDALMAKAQAFTGLTRKSAIVRRSLKVLMELAKARCLARRGSSEPVLVNLFCRQPEPADTGNHITGSNPAPTAAYFIL